MEAKEPILNKSEIFDLYPIISALDKAITLYGGSVVPDKVLIDLKNEINKLFHDDPLCRTLYISNNTDKEFFGILIKPSLKMNDLVLKDDLRDINVVKEYSIDIDSKLFSIGLSARQIISLIIYDVYQIMDIEAIRDIAATIDAICAGRRCTLKDTMIGYECIRSLLEYCSCDYLYRSRSIFARSETELVRVPQLLTAYELDSEFVEALEVVNANRNGMYNQVPLPSLSLNWAFNVISNFTPRSLYAIKVLKSAMECTGSDLMKNFIKSIMEKFTSTNIQYQKKEIIGEGSLFSGIRKNGLKSLENDLFEYEMRIKNIDDENSAIFLMRQINSRMGIISDYMEEEKIADTERKRWEKIYDRYDKLRIKMTNKPIYSRKMYGLFTDYNALMQPGSENLMTINTMY